MSPEIKFIDAWIRAIACLALIGGFGLASPAMAAAQGGAGQRAAEALGKGVYRIGPIVLDKPGRRFTVTGRIIRLEAPLPRMRMLQRPISTRNRCRAIPSSSRFRGTRTVVA